jgi:Zn-dependent peptidase ImmA (M78 family)
MQALIGMLQIRQEWLSEYRQRSGRPRLEFIGKFDATVAPQKAARDMRAVLRLPDDWPRASSTRADALATLANQAEAAGVVVVFNSVLGNNTHQRLREEDFSGFALVDQYAPFIFINTGRERAKAAQIFTLAHELAHLWLGQSGISRVTLGQEAGQEIERACNRIAAAFLMPEALFRAAWQELHQEPLQEMTYRLSEQWKVSRAAIVVRALELNLLDRVQGDTLLEELRSSYEEREEKAAHAGGDFYRMQMRRLGRPFVEAVIEALEEEELSYREAEELLDVRAKALTRLLDRFTPS